MEQSEAVINQLPNLAGNFAQKCVKNFLRALTTLLSNYFFAVDPETKGQN